MKKVKLGDVITTVAGKNKLVASGSMFWLQTVVDITIGKKLCKNYGLDREFVLMEVLRKKLFDKIKKKHEKFNKDKKAHAPNVLVQKAKSDFKMPKARNRNAEGEDEEENARDNGEFNCLNERTQSSLYTRLFSH